MTSLLILIETGPQVPEDVVFEWLQAVNRAATW